MFAWFNIQRLYHIEISINYNIYICVCVCGLCMCVRVCGLCMCVRVCMYSHSWLRQYTKTWKVAGSIPNWVDSFSNIGRLPMWRIGERSPDVVGTGEIKYPGWTKTSTAAR